MKKESALKFILVKQTEKKKVRWAHTLLLSTLLFQRISKNRINLINKSPFTFNYHWISFKIQWINYYKPGIPRSPGAPGGPGCPVSPYKSIKS